MNAQHEAQIRLRAILNTIKEQAHHGRPDLIPLSDYVDEQTYNFLLPNPGWHFLEWQAVNREVARQLAARGYNVQLVPLEMNEYFDFLAKYDLKNEPQTRAMYVSWKILPPGTEFDPRV